jgi:Restriction endonuclease
MRLEDIRNHASEVANVFMLKLATAAKSRESALSAAASVLYDTLARRMEIPPPWQIPSSEYELKLRQLPVAVVYRQLAARFERASSVFPDDSQLLYDRATRRDVWASPPARLLGMWYDVEGYGRLHIASLSRIKVRNWFRASRRSITALEKDVLAETNARFFEDRFARFVDGLSPSDFEDFVASVISRMGFSALLTPVTNDNGVDIIALAYSGDVADIGKAIIFQCKKTKNTVGVRLVRELAGARLLHGADRAILVTNSHFSDRALRSVCEPAYYGIALADLEATSPVVSSDESYRTSNIKSRSDSI